MKKITSVLSAQPVAYATAVQAVIAALVLLHVLSWSPEQVAGVVAAMTAVLNIFVWSAVTPNRNAQAQVRTAEHVARSKALADVASLAKKAAK